MKTNNPASKKPGAAQSLRSTFQLIPHESYLVVRDDLFPGGTKARPLIRIMGNIPQQQIVYAAEPNGYAALALAEATKQFNRQLKLYYPFVSEFSQSMKNVIYQKHVSFEVVSNIYSQLELEKVAIQNIHPCEAHLIPIGFNFTEFQETLVEIIKEMDILPDEVWVIAGSGCLARSINKAWPSSRVNAVSLGLPQLRLDEGIKVYEAPEKLNEKAVFPPPFPSAEYYDAKLWRFVKQYASDNALVWNVAG